ncbi:MAG: ABC transporter permease, partial [Chloroflexi bacterium]|nr:ABC transporter permease [Chloroflexota bacterium]
KNPRAARYAGINVRRQVVYAMVWSGGFAGLAGIVQVIGLRYLLQSEGAAIEFTDNAGFNGIVVALFGGLHPIGTIPAAVFFGGLLNGGGAMRRAVQVESSMITALNGLIVVFVVSSQIFIRRRTRRRVTVANQERERPAENAV